MYGTLLDAMGTIGTAGYWGVEALVAGSRLACLLPGGVSSGEGGFWTPSMGVAGGKFVASSLQE